jgi:hypothetical protein
LLIDYNQQTRNHLKSGKIDFNRTESITLVNRL